MNLTYQMLLKVRWHWETSIADLASEWLFSRVRSNMKNKLIPVLKGLATEFAVERPLFLWVKLFHVSLEHSFIFESFLAFSALVSEFILKFLIMCRLMLHVFLFRHTNLLTVKAFVEFQVNLIGRFLDFVLIREVWRTVERLYWGFLTMCFDGSRRRRFYKDNEMMTFCEQVVRLNYLPSNLISACSSSLSVCCSAIPSSVSKPSLGVSSIPSLMYSSIHSKFPASVTNLLNVSLALSFNQKVSHLAQRLKCRFHHCSSTFVGTNSRTWGHSDIANIS